MGGEEIDEWKIKTRKMYSIFNVDIPPMFNHNLFTSLSTNRKIEENSIRCDVNLIRYKFQHRKAASLCEFPVIKPGTLSDSSLCDSLRNSLGNGRLPLDFPTAESHLSDLSLC